MSPEELTNHLTRNELVWQQMTALGLQPGATFTVDFGFYATKPVQRDSLVPVLEASGMSIKITQTRVLIIFKGWQIMASETAVWTLEKLQQRTKELFAEAEKCDLLFESVGALLPKTPKAG